MTAGDIFTGTARFYADYRPRYPDRLLDDLRPKTVGERGGHLIDWGCGTGEVALPLSSYFDQVTAIDNDPEMVAVARDRAAEAGITNINWQVGKAEDLNIAEDSCDLITAGSSFHWMDRQLLATRAHQGLREHGALALIGGGSSVWDERAEWHPIAVKCLRRYLGEPRRAGSGTYAVTKKHEDYLVPAGFQIENYDYPTTHCWSVDEIVGYLYSTSFAGPQVLGDKQQAFEADLRSQLQAAKPDGASAPVHRTLW